MQLKVSLRQSTRARKANHNTSSMLFIAYAICAQVTHTACVWFAWERGMRRWLSRFALLPKGPLLQGGFLQKRSHGVRSEIWWRDRRRASLYLHPHLSDPMTAPRDWKPARRILPLRQRPQRFSCLLPRKLTKETLDKSPPLFRPSMRSWWRWSLVLLPSWISTGWPSALSNRRKLWLPELGLGRSPWWRGETNQRFCGVQLYPPH